MYSVEGLGDFVCRIRLRDFVCRIWLRDLVEVLDLSSSSVIEMKNLQVGIWISGSRFQVQCAVLGAQD